MPESLFHKVVGLLHIITLRKKCLNAEFFVVRIFPYLVQIRENTDQKNSVFGHFLHSVIKTKIFLFVTTDTVKIVYYLGLEIVSSELIRAFFDNSN